jgi:hypothetical protein
MNDVVLDRSAAAQADAARAVVAAFFEAMLTKPDPARAASLTSPDLQITYAGGRRFKRAEEISAFNRRRYRWVRKKLERQDVIPGVHETIIYNAGTLYGEWPDGTPFESDRYLDRLVVRDGKIVQLDVLNDSAESLLIKNGLDV